MKIKGYIIFTLLVLCTIALPFISNWSSGFRLFENLSDLVNKQIVYQSITFFLTIGLLVILRILRKEEFTTYFRKGDLSAEIITVPAIGIKPKKNENWWHIGRNFTIIITLVTATVIYFQLLKGKDVNYTTLLIAIPMALVFSLINSFVEESITRLGVVITLKNQLPDYAIMLISGLLFGVIHYWGNPGGVVGMLVAGFLGWFLAKSILETNGFFWAWFIHFVQDVVIFTAMFGIK